MRYRIITGVNVEGLEKDVNLAIKAGWKPQGGVVMQGYAFAQALVKTDESDLEKSWQGAVDRQSGAFTDEEIHRSTEWR